MIKEILVREYFKLVLMIGAFLYVTIKILVKKRLLTTLRFDSENLKKAINIITIPFVYFCLIVSLYVYYPLLLDIPHVIRGEYFEAEGIVKSNDIASPHRYVKRYIKIDNGVNTEEYMLYSFGLYEGDICKYLYLPNSHIGQVVEIEDEIEPVEKN